MELCPNDGAPSLELLRARLDGISSNLAHGRSWNEFIFKGDIKMNMSSF